MGSFCVHSSTLPNEVRPFVMPSSRPSATFTTFLKIDFVRLSVNKRPEKNTVGFLFWKVIPYRHDSDARIMKLANCNTAGSELRHDFVFGVVLSFGHLNVKSCVDRRCLL